MFLHLGKQQAQFLTGTMCHRRVRAAGKLVECLPGGIKQEEEHMFEHFEAAGNVAEGLHWLNQVSTQVEVPKAEYKKPRKHLQVAEDDEVPAKKPNIVVEADPSEVPGWTEILENIREMRKSRDAPVDSMGAEKCAEKAVDPKMYRFHVLVSLMLSSQTKDNVTFAAMERLKTYGLNVESILAIDLEDLRKIIYPVGFYKRKAEFLKKTCAILKQQYDNDIPKTLEDLCSLPGVGPKMGYLCMNIAWNEVSGIGVDTHVHRIANRLGWTKRRTKTAEETRLQLQSWLPK